MAMIYEVIQWMTPKGGELLVPIESSDGDL